MEANGIVTLLSDFGLEDPYVGVMKGVLLTENPALRLVDLGHALPPHAVETAAFFLRSQWSWFPDGTTHLVVVDPGVGTDRRALAVRGERVCFVAPDNGVLAPVLRELDDWEAHELPLPDGASFTFHGRDVFAPAAALVASGRAPWERWPVVDPSVPTEEHPRKVSGEAECWEGFRVIHVDRFGNVVTDVERRRFGGTIASRPFRVELGEGTVETLRQSYGSAPAGELFAIWGSLDTLEISLREARACDLLEVERGCSVRLFFPH